MTLRSCALTALLSLLLSGCAQAHPDRSGSTSDRADPAVFAAAGP